MPALRRHLLTPLLVVLALGVTGCGDDSGGEQAATGKLGAAATGPTETIETDQPDDPDTDDPSDDVTKPAGLSEVEGALADWLIGFGEGDGDSVCDLQTPRYSRELVQQSVDGGYTDKGATCSEAVEDLAELIEENGGMQNFDIVTDSESGDKAELTVDYQQGGSSEKYEMKRVDGDWLVHKELN